MKAGQTINELGLYSTECCGSEHMFDTGDILDRCPECHAPCRWQIEDELVTTAELERFEGIAA